MKKITAALAGAGQRGMDALGSYALDHPNEIEFIAVAEPDNKKREKFKKLHNISDDMCFSHWKELLDKLNSIPCDLVLLDLSMPIMNGLEALKKIRKCNSKLKVLVLTMHKDNEHFRHAMRNGASGYVLKNDVHKQLFMAIYKVMDGERFVSPTMSQYFFEDYLRAYDGIERGAACPEILTPSEKNVLQLVSMGNLNKDIAKKLNINTRTVETHRENIMKKIGVNNTARLVKYALSQGIIS